MQVTTSRKKFVSRLVKLSLFVVILSLIAACAPGVSPAAQPGAPAAGTDDQVTLQLWHHWSTSRHPLLQDVVNQFMEENPDIVVIETLQPQEGILEKLLTSIAGGAPPDVAMLHRRNLLSFAAEGALTPLDDFVQAEGIPDDYWYPGEFESNIYDGQVYGLPLTEGATFLNYNTRLFEEAGLDPDEFPQTWEEFFDVAVQLTTYNNSQVDVAGYAVGTNFGRTFLMWLVSNGQESIYSEDGTTALVNTEAGIETIDFLQRLVDEAMGGYQNVQAFDSASSGLDQPAFATELSAIETGQAWQFLVFASVSPDLEYRLAPFPAGPSGDTPKTINQTSWSYVIPTGSQNIEAAWRLLHYLTVADGARDFLTAQDRASPVREYNESAHYVDVPHWDEFLEVTAVRGTIGVSAVQPEVENILSEMVERVLIGQLTPEEAADWANAEVQRLLDDFWATR